MHRSMDLSYFKVNKLLWRWSKEGGARIVHDVSLSLDRPPPAREEPKPPPAAVKKTLKPKHEVGDGLLKIMELHSRFKTWLETPDPPKPLKPPKHSKPSKQEDNVPPFDIQEIPGAMRKIHLPVSAALMDRWFAGRLNYSPTDPDETVEINQEGKPYPPDMYDATTIKLDWVLRFPRAKEKYAYLINEAIRSPKALEELGKQLAPYKDRVTILDAADICNDDTASLHHRFQFQRTPVDGTLGQKINLFLSNVGRNGAPDDLTGALGSFVIYATIGHLASPGMSVDTRRTTAEVKGIWVYVKDNYSFTDRQGDRSQYLGHWSCDGVIVIPLDAVAATASYIPYVESSVILPYINAPVALGDPLVRGNVYYPVHNSDFRQWAIRHQRGGDFVIYSDRRYVPIVPPIEVAL